MDGRRHLSAVLPLPTRPGGVAGTIVDPDGAAVPDIAVVLKTLHGDPLAGGSANSDAVGRFHLTGIASGDYEFAVPAKYGFEQYQAPIHVRPGMHDLRIRLTPLVITQDVVVGPETSQVTLDPSANRDQVSTSGRKARNSPRI